MNPSPPELFPERPIRSDFGRAPSYRTRRIITILVALLLLGGIFRWAFGGPSISHPGEIPTIKAEGAWKQKPEQPGGIDIPHQDVEVYQALDGKDAAKPEVEHLLPPPEVPQVPAPAGNTVSNAAPAPIPSTPQTENLTPPVANEAPAPAPVPAVAAPPVIAATVESQPAKPAATPPVSQTVKKKVTVTSKADRIVQLASVPDETSAQEMMGKLQAHYVSILGDVQLRLVQADLGAKGVFYRIQSQPLSGERADKICAAIKKSKGGCILVR